jgi:hypothetical protein
MEMSCQLQAPHTLPPGKQLLVSIGSEWGGGGGRAVGAVEKRKMVYPCWESNSNSSVVQNVHLYIRINCFV